MVVDASGTPARARPGVVTASSWLLILVAAIQVVNLIITLATIGTFRTVLRDAYRGTSVEQAADVAWVFGLVGAVLTLLLAAALVVLALLNNRGRNGARITTWVLGGILLCCSGGSLVNNTLGGMMNGSTSGDVPSGQEIQRRLDDALPGWYGSVTTLLGAVAVLALLAALILLALPRANGFFRRRKQPAWEPPVPGAAWPAPSQPPGYPPAPGQPGQPSASGQPPTWGEGARPGPTDRPGPAPGSGERREPEPPPGS